MLIPIYIYPLQSMYGYIDICIEEKDDWGREKGNGSTTPGESRV